MQEIPKEEKKEKKNYVEFSLGTVIIAITIVALIIGDIWLGIYAYKLRNQEESIDNSIENNINV